MASLRGLRRVMRAWVALAVIVLLVGPADALERVVFCTGDAPACARGKTLGRAAQQSWAVVDDRDLLVAAAARKAVPPILYATRSDYEDAVAGLAVDERARAVLARRKVVATDPW